MADLITVATRAIAAFKGVNSAADRVLPEDIVKIVKRHAKIAVATAFIPVGGLDVVAATANIWTMYVKINSALGVKFSDNKTKSICSAIVSNLVQNLGIAAVVSGLKFTGFGLPAAIAILSGALYGLTITAGWIYLKSLANLSLHDGDIEKALKDTLRDKAEWSKVYEQNKKK